jgi:hypothetical protein
MISVLYSAWTLHFLRLQVSKRLVGRGFFLSACIEAPETRILPGDMRKHRDGNEEKPINWPSTI